MSWWNPKPTTVTVNVAHEANTYGIGLVPGRSDELIALHVGTQHILLSPAEACELSEQLFSLAVPKP